ncbi:MAG: cytidine deaminase [Candidatus Azobacteroides sp.]|nr:cytidine deaminase [Candidatus Azobacteroides sp.]
MKELNIITKITISSYEELSMEEKKLIDSAKNATQNAYAPYSKFKVGAAILLGNGEIITGNNQENVAYPSGICAERVAVFHANAMYPDIKIKTIAIAACFNGDYTENISPCGACRQVLQETEARYHSPIRVLLYGKEEIYIVESIKDLLPLSFSF